MYGITIKVITSLSLSLVVWFGPGCRMDEKFYLMYLKFEKPGSIGCCSLQRASFLLSKLGFRLLLLHAGVRWFSASRAGQRHGAARRPAAIQRAGRQRDQIIVRFSKLLYLY